MTKKMKISKYISAGCIRYRKKCPLNKKVNRVSQKCLDIRCEYFVGTTQEEVSRFNHLIG